MKKKLWEVCFKGNIENRSNSNNFETVPLNEIVDFIWILEATDHKLVLNLVFRYKDYYLAIGGEMVSFFLSWHINLWRLFNAKAILLEEQ